MNRIQWQDGAPRSVGDCKRFTCNGRTGEVDVTSKREARIVFDDGFSATIRGGSGLAWTIAEARHQIRQNCPPAEESE